MPVVRWRPADALHGISQSWATRRNRNHPPPLGPCQRIMRDTASENVIAAPAGADLPCLPPADDSHPGEQRKQPSVPSSVRRLAVLPHSCTRQHAAWPCLASLPLSIGLHMQPAVVCRNVAVPRSQFPYSAPACAPQCAASTCQNAHVAAECGEASWACRAWAARFRS